MNTGSRRGTDPTDAATGPAPAQNDARYDLFLCHNREDKPVVRELRDALRALGLRTWFDEDQLVPGRPWQEALEQAIESIRAAAICVGPSGIGPWQNRELRAYINEFVRKEASAIPVLLPGAAEKPELPTFLRAVTWADLRAGFSDESLHPLICGIKGTAPAETPIRRRSAPTPDPSVVETPEPDVEPDSEAAAEEDDPSQGRPKAAFIADELIQAVCDQLNAEAGPFRTLRAQLITRLTDEAPDDAETNVDFLAQALTEQLNEVMSTLRMWLDSTDSIEGGEEVRRLINAVGTAGFQADWVGELLAELGTGHLHVPVETDLHLCEVIFTALYRKPATWIREKEIDHDAIRAISTPSPKPRERAREIRRRLVQTYFKDRVSREVGEGDADFEKRLDDWAERDLPAVLEADREDQKPWFVLFLEAVDALRKDMEIDPSLWSQILKLEKSRDHDRFVFDRAKLHHRVIEMHKRLDELAVRARKGARP